MSIQLSNENGWIISHLKYLHEMYTNIDYCNTKCTLKFNDNIFNINSSYIRANQMCQIKKRVLAINDKKKLRKRKRNESTTPINIQEIEFLQQSLEKMIANAINEGLFTDSIDIDYNEQARIASKQFYSDDDTDNISMMFNGGNQSNNTVITKIGSIEYVIPKNCLFYSYDIRDIKNKLKLNNQFDFILMDPPWWNKFIRRHKSCSYKMMYNEELCQIPIQNLLSINGIIAIWCTNSTTHLNYIIDIMFPKWGIKFIAKWYWIKVTQRGNVICNFNYGTGKQPYELLIFGASLSNLNVKIPDKKLLISVPSAVHSHKPPITEVIKPYLVQNPNCIEIFARYLLPGWTSWGLEVLKFQCLSLYSVIKLNNNIDQIKNPEFI